MCAKDRSQGPMRMCAICRRRSPKRELDRYVRTPDGPALDPKQVMPGRGMYLCQDPACREKWKKIGFRKFA